MTRVCRPIRENVSCCWLVVALLLLTTLHVIRPAEAAERLFLQLDTGGHMSLIRSIVFTPDGQRLISASDDKTIRIWDLKSGRTVSTLRGDIGEGEAGKIYTLAISPDGQWLAAGGRTGLPGMSRHPIRIYDLSTGQFAFLLDGHVEPVLSLAFSPDGKLLGSGGMDDRAVLWNLADGSRAAVLEGHKGDVNGIRFTPAGGRVVTGSDDRSLRIWSVGDGGTIATLEGHTDLVVSVAVSKDGSIASSSFDQTVRLWDIEGRPRAVINSDNRVIGLAFSPDGRLLLAGPGTQPFVSRVFDLTKGELVGNYDGHDNLVYAAAFSPDGRLAATPGGNNHEIHLWDPLTGKLVLTLAGSGQAVWSAGISKDGRQIAWGHVSHSGTPNEISALTNMLRLPEGDRPTGEPRPIAAEDEFVRAVARVEALGLSHRSTGDFGYNDTVEISSTGQISASILRGERDGYAHTSYSFTPDGRAVITGGGNGYLSIHDPAGRKLGDFDGHTGDVWAVAVSPDGRLLLSASGDQTLRLWNIATRKNIVSLFHAQNGEWVMWTPQGYFAASPDGDDYVGWQINQGADKEARFVTASQLKRHFYRPDIIRRALVLASAAQAIEEAEARDFTLDELLRRSPPVLEITNPRSGPELTEGRARLTVLEHTGEPIESFEVTVNGRRVNPDVRTSELAERRQHVLEVPLANGENRIVLTAINAVGRTEQSLVLHHSGVGEFGSRGTLYIVSIGVDDYRHLGQNLDYAGADARAVTKALMAHAGPLFAGVKRLVLAKGGDFEPTAENVRKALTLLGEAKPEDTVVLFLAGHGVNDGAEYLFLPGDARRDKNGWVKESVVSWQTLQSVIESAQGRRVMFVDTCHAGNAFNPRLVKDAGDASIAVFAATDADTVAQERRDLGHGVFTFSVLRGMGGAADIIRDRVVEARELSGFVAKTVAGLTRGKQNPVVHLPKPANFTIARY